MKFFFFKKYEGDVIAFPISSKGHSEYLSEIEIIFKLPR